MVLVLTLWQKKASGYPTRAGESRLEDPTEARFGKAVAELLGTVESNAKPFQIVAQMGDSSRAHQMETGVADEEVAAELWKGYQSLVGVNG